MKTRVALVFVVASAQVAQMGSAQADWQAQTFQTRPTGVDTDMVYDSARDRIVICGAPTLPGPMETWEWDNVDWKLVKVGGLPARRLFLLVYDTKRQRTVLFGGRVPGPMGSVIYLNDTWAWDGTQWTQLADGPMKQVFASTVSGAYDSDRDRIVADGVVDGAGIPSTYEFDGNNWRKVSASAIYMFFGGRMVYDAQRRECVATGDASTGGGGLVAEWDGLTWTILKPTFRPPNRSFPSLAWDALRARTVLFGGRSSQGLLADTWEWDGTAWTQPTVTPSTPGVLEPMTFDTLRQRIVRVSLAVKTNWNYATSQPAMYQAFGVPCNGSLGAVALQPSRYELPWLGGTFRMLVGPVPTTSAAALMLGNSTTSAGGVALPFSLTGLGMTGCSLYVSPDLVLPAVSVGLEGATVDVALPAIPALAGRQFHVQALALDAGANPLGLVTTNAGTGVVGIR